MNLRPQKQQEPDINLTPLIDVVFLLLIFFMVTTKFKHDSELKIELPEASAEPVTQEREVMVVSIDAQGQFAIGNQRVLKSTPEEFKRALQKVVKDTSIPLVVRADGRAPTQAIVTVMDAAQQLGFQNLSVATVQPPQK